IDECPISIECKVKSIIPLGTHDLFIADVVGSHVDSKLMDDKGKIHFEEADLITYCHGEYFKMDKYPLGKFGYSVAKKPVAIKNSTNSTEKVNDNKKEKDLSKNKVHNKNNNYNSSNSSKKRNNGKNKPKSNKKNTSSLRRKTR
ncbi:flavin reductase, partial [Clostridium saudiense]|nr:flavin reductase [Clostridium saudiense]